jgi:hypothetical protein
MHDILPPPATTADSAGTRGSMAWIGDLPIYRASERVNRAIEPIPGHLDPIDRQSDPHLKLLRRDTRYIGKTAPDANLGVTRRDGDLSISRAVPNLSQADLIGRFWIVWRQMSAWLTLSSSAADIGRRAQAGRA